VVELWAVWAGAKRPSKALWATAGAGVGDRASVRAVVHIAVTVHSHVRLFTRSAALWIGSRQGARRYVVSRFIE